MATAAVGSCFSATVTPRLRSKLVRSDVDLRLPPHRPCHTLSITQVRENLYTPVITSQIRRPPRALAAVAQDEVTAAVEEEMLTAEGGGEGEGPKVATAATRNTKLYFGNLPYNCNSAQLAKCIEEYARPELVEVLYDKETGRSRGYAFVTMSTVEDCEEVIKNLDGSQYDGRTLRVNFSDKPKPKEPLNTGSEYELYVANLSWSVTSEVLAKVFQEHGNVVGARILYDGDTGRSRGYGFVCYSSKEEMDNAMKALNGVELEGRAMRISLALARKT